jgi:transcriptional regulator with XRE-family HTH domain
MRQKRAVGLIGQRFSLAPHLFKGRPSMITSEQDSLLYELRQKPISEATLVELESRLEHRIHSMVLDAFNASGISQKELADRLGWDTGRVSRVLGSSSNLTLRTISALLAAIGVDLDDPSYTSFDELEQRLRMHAASPAVTRQNKKLHREFLERVQLELGLTQRQCSGANSVIIPDAAVGAVTETMQPKIHGAKIFPFPLPLMDQQNILGEDQSDLQEILANAG